MITQNSQNQTDKKQNCSFSWVWGSRGKEWVGYCPSGVKFQFYKMKRDMGRDDDSGCNTINLFNTIELLKSN